MLFLLLGAVFNTVGAQDLPALQKINKKDSVLLRTFCKNLYVAMMAAQKQAAELVKPVPVSARKPAFIQIKGSVRYDFMYRSFTDTPFLQKDFQQHTLQTNLQVTIKEKYPFRVAIATRVSNSPFFRNFMDLNFQFDRYAFNRDYKQQLLKKLQEQYRQHPELDMVQDALKEKLEKYNSLRSRLSDPDTRDQLVKEKEDEYNRRLAAAGLIPAIEKPADVLQALNEKLTHKPGRVSKQQETIDSVKNKYSGFIADKKTELEQLRQQISQLQAKADSIKRSFDKQLSQVRQLVNRAGSLSELKKIARDHAIPQEQENRADKILSNIKTLGVGRSVINYSELTAMNISLTGINIEYNPRVYMAFAAGRIDYGFRDFFGRSRTITQKKQQLLMGRFGLGNIDKKAIILSVFTGRKYNYAPLRTDTVSNTISLAGYAVETILKKDENTSLHLELAKSTGPATGGFNENKELGSLLRFNTNRNVAVHLKGQTMLNATGTRLSGFFRKSGNQFQSFSLFTYNTDQLAWLFKADQSFLKNRVGVIAMLRRNDFTNPLAEKTFKTSTVFKSVQVNLRFPKWPSVSAGYYPGSQLYVIDRERARENVYYILNGTVIHQYKAGGIRMLSSFIYNQYQSRGTDSGFIAYNGTNYLLSHSLFWDKLQLQGSYAYTQQPEMNYGVTELNAEYSPVKLLRIGAGGKYNKIMKGNNYWGGRAQVVIDLPAIGSIQLQYEKSFLPTIYRTLFPVEIGRVSWYKNF